MARIVILTGAGISAESGLGTFRDKDGLWTQVKLEDVATPEGFARNPEMVQDFYNARRSNCQEAEPNAAHFALAKLRDVLLVTQNVDDLHERAGSQGVVHMHGELLRGLCGACGASWEQQEDISVSDACPACGAKACRPDVVWFGEMPYHMERIEAALAGCELFVSIGTSGEVYPAAGFAAGARLAGASTLELNLEPTGGQFDEGLYGPASEIVPAWVADILR